MRLKLAQALFVTSDLVLFDECTNHLDLFGLEWLISYLTSHRGEKTLIVVSHDRTFLDAICTDIVVLEHHRLAYHVGNYSEYERQVSEKAARETQILDAAERQRSKAVAFVQKQQAAANKKTADPNKQRQAKMIREKKLDRIGNYREDGKRYKTRSLKKLSEDHLRLAQKVVVEEDDPVVKMRFPDPSWPPGVSAHDALIRIEDFAFGYDKASVLFRDVTLNVTRGSKVAIVGRNGCGKSTLVNLISGGLDVQKHYSRGQLWVHPGLRLGHVTQYAVESLAQHFSHLSTAEYAEQVIFGSGRASADAVTKASGNVRQYLGAFGLGGRHALQRIGKLSGGERMRLCFATVLAEQPHILLLDESTNHVDITTLDSMSSALNSFQGAVLMVSHNQGFLSGFCNELWVVDRQRVTVHHSDAATFDEIFSEYRSSIHGQASGINRTAERKEKAERAKRATQQRSGTRQTTSLL
jgi:ATP-binding cassette subfamily F protein 3